MTPNLYDVSFTVRDGDRKVAGYSLHSGIRSIKVSGGRLYLNGQPMNIRGVGLHEDSKAQGFAIDNARRDQLVAQAKELGATVLRTHYPLHPYTHELADRLGLLIWSEIPVYSVKTEVLKEPSVRRLAVTELGKNINANENHPSVMLWSIGNELSSQPGPVQEAYIASATKFAKEMDPTRPVGLAVAAYPSSLCQADSYTPLDVLGLNDYFGWYPGPSGQIFDRTKLSGYLDAARNCYPDKALMVSEFGAEANRDGPIEEKGTWAFQQEWINYQLGVFATKPWLSGAIYWALNEFWVRPGWEGGNPRPVQPLHQKGLITYDGVKKPAWADVQRAFTTHPAVPSGKLARARGGALGAQARSACASARGGEQGRRACRGRSASACRTAPRTAVGCRRRGRLRLVEMRSFPPPPESSSSSGVHVDALSERRNIRKSSAAQHQGHKMENSEDHKQLRIGGH